MTNFSRVPISVWSADERARLVDCYMPPRVKGMSGAGREGSGRGCANSLWA